MSFIYACKLIDQCTNVETIEIYSDTKIILDEIEQKSLEGEVLRNFKNYGLIKIIFVNQQCCIAFAGNNIKLVYELLELYYSNDSKKIDVLIELAYKLHLENPINDIEFIICYNDNNNLKHIVCIKNHQKYSNEPFCWIGSKSTFEIMQKERIKNNFSIHQSFINAVESGIDESVGLFIIMVKYSNELKKFKFIERMYTVVSKPITYKTGEFIKLFDSKQNGGFSIKVSEINNKVYLYIAQLNKIIIYSNGISCKSLSESVKEKYKYYLCPYEKKRKYILQSRSLLFCKK